MYWENVKLKREAVYISVLLSKKAYLSVITGKKNHQMCILGFNTV